MAKRRKRKASAFAPKGVRNILKGGEDFARKCIRSGGKFNRGG